MVDSLEKDNTDIIINTKNWVEEFVIGLSLCPFAKSPFENGSVRIVESSSILIDKWAETFIKECNAIVQTDIKSLSNTLIVFPYGLEDFYFFLDILETFQEMLEKSQLDDTIQLASFHPHYQFEGVEVDDVRNYTNRSPYPIIHLLRVIEVENAIVHHGNTDEIPIRNQSLMQKIGKRKIINTYLLKYEKKKNSE